MSWIRGRANLLGYTSFKAAIPGLSRTLARELGEKNIRVNVPGVGRNRRSISSFDSNRRMLPEPLCSLGQKIQMASPARISLSMRGWHKYRSRADQERPVDITSSNATFPVRKILRQIRNSPTYRRVFSLLKSECEILKGKPEQTEMYMIVST